MVDAFRDQTDSSNTTADNQDERDVNLANGEKSQDALNKSTASSSSIDDNLNEEPKLSVEQNVPSDAENDENMTSTTTTLTKPAVNTIAATADGQEMSDKLTMAALAGTTASSSNYLETTLEITEAGDSCNHFTLTTKISGEKEVDISTAGQEDSVQEQPEDEQDQQPAADTTVADADSTLITG